MPLQVEAGIDRVFGTFNTDKLLVFDDLHAFLDELGSYSRELDEMGEPAFSSHQGQDPSPASWPTGGSATYDAAQSEQPFTGRRRLDPPLMPAARRRPGAGAGIWHRRRFGRAPPRTGDCFRAPSLSPMPAARRPARCGSGNRRQFQPRATPRARR